ncbi:MAG: bifunctional DNA-formamidopyrimidine glycosylase/DNA-(apurinic or apyrimidinic site) lyase [bacterium]
MPELPEVETVRGQLDKELRGEEIGKVEVRDRKVFEGKEKGLIGEKIKKIRRVGKYLFMYFESGRGLAMHLKMTGRLVVDDKWYKDAKHTRVVVTMKSGRKLYYWDTRKFGYLRIESGIEKVEKKIREKLGPEPWKIEKEALLGRFKKTGRTVKDTILDQSVIAGVGNIYANDGLWKSGISPHRKARSLSLKEVGKLLASLRAVMERGLRTGGASDNSYLDAYGKKGSYQEEFLTYGKTKGECKKCGRKLTNEKIGGRGTWWCESCQV